jgi:flagellar FliL protein
MDAKPEAVASQTNKGSAGLSTMALLTVVGLVAVGAGVASPYLAKRVLGPKEAVIEEDRGHGHSSAAAGRAEMEFVPFGEVVVNLNDGRMNRYLRLSLTVQVDTKHAEEIKKGVEKHKVVLKDWLLRYLSDRQMEEIRGTAGQNRLRREIRDQFNTVLCPDGSDRVHDAYFEEFNVQ